MINTTSSNYNIKGRIGRRLIKIREQRNRSQEWVSNEAMMSKTTLRSVETGYGNYTIDTLCKIANVYHLPIEDLFTRSDEEDKIIYQCVPHPAYSEETGQHTAYGLLVSIDGIHDFFIPNLSTQQEKVHHLASLCSQHALSPLHLQDVMEEFL